MSLDLASNIAKGLRLLVWQYHDRSDGHGIRVTVPGSESEPEHETILTICKTNLESFLA